ncbi:ABC transporter ATP-binding protein [Phyllobacterium endophyticum]|uniref:Nickel import ATP-binding protein NikD n=1 Tax=Phyllobacterium endophyticum TaxID=1149773 RepID=A0A2P7ARE9_9HYPH|nr:ABC transporter ATP-binding protein [Phyllobacterium endophyticum]MBB3237479.1 ABC-type dipeptide/oligopeptide/nickel transport system ATPase component [Phyllobacterium endophyticum]PSH56802.1 nickel import ATP-binding protein NikD [Phyllobacterium endophyticum]TYR44214.1 ABC transporter ATP-binding protein [Phyllobacterium endophyticum]
MSIPYLSVRDLSVSFVTGTGNFYAIDGISFDLARGEILALVGESGSGKSMTSLSIMKLLPAVAQMSGRIQIEGQDISAFGRRQMQDVRGAKIGMIFQEPMTSLNPVLTIARQMTEGLVRHNGVSRREALATSYTWLEDVGIPEPDRVLAQYPHQLSGGMRQRIMIAAALALRPGILIADEPTTALDVTVQSQVLDLLVDLKSRSGSGILLITHDIGVVAETADRVAVMRGGRIVETGTVDEVLRSPQHDYTKALLASHLTVDKGLKQREAEFERARP